MDSNQYNTLLKVIAQLGDQMTLGFAQLRAEFKQEIKKEINQLRSEMRQGFAEQTAMSAEILDIVGASFQSLEARVVKLEQK